jgi:protein phosphatase 1 regulatory subunit 11
MTQTGSATPDTRTPEDQAGPSDPIVGVLKLRGDRSARRQKVVFSEGTVDNEGMGKKKSKSE